MTSFRATPSGHDATFDRYGTDVLSADPHRRPPVPHVPADVGLVVEDAETGFTGAVVRVEKSGGMHVVVLADRHHKERAFRLGPGFWIDGKPVHLTAPPARTTAPPPQRTASGSRAVHGARARVARASRIWVEGRHDAELVEKVWGEDLRLEGVVVEMLDGVDDLAARAAQFAPGPGRRLGVLVDHLVPGSKEDRIATEALRACGPEHLLVVGHPYVDIWQAVRPAAVGIGAWPVVPPGRPWKEGVCAALGVADPPAMWRRVLGGVRTYRDLETPLIGAVEQLIDFVTEAS